MLTKHKARLCQDVNDRVLQKQAKYTDNKLKALKARNEYLLCLDAANAAVHKYFTDDLPDLIDVSSCGISVLSWTVSGLFKFTWQYLELSIHQGAQCDNSIPSLMNLIINIYWHFTDLLIVTKMSWQFGNRSTGFFYLVSVFQCMDLWYLSFSAWTCDICISVHGPVISVFQCMDLWYLYFSAWTCAICLSVHGPVISVFQCMDLWYLSFSAWTCDICLSVHGPVIFVFQCMDLWYLSFSAWTCDICLSVHGPVISVFQCMDLWYLSFSAWTWATTTHWVGRCWCMCRRRRTWSSHARPVWTSWTSVLETWSNARTNIASSSSTINPSPPLAPSTSNPTRAMRWGWSAMASSSH